MTWVKRRLGGIRFLPETDAEAVFSQNRMKDNDPHFHNYFKVNVKFLIVCTKCNQKI